MSKAGHLAVYLAVCLAASRVAWTVDDSVVSWAASMAGHLAVWTVHDSVVSWAVSMVVQMVATLVKQ